MTRPGTDKGGLLWRRNTRTGRVHNLNKIQYKCCLGHAFCTGGTFSIKIQNSRDRILLLSSIVQLTIHYLLQSEFCTLVSNLAASIILGQHSAEYYFEILSKVFASGIAHRLSKNAPKLLTWQLFSGSILRQGFTFQPSIRSS